MTLKKETIEAILNYLARRPYLEVANLITSIQGELKDSAKREKPELKKVGK